MKDLPITYYTDMDHVQHGKRITAAIYAPGEGWIFVLRYAPDGSSLIVPTFQHLETAPLLHPSQQVLLSVSGLAALEAWYNFALENLADRPMRGALDFSMKHYHAAYSLYSWLHDETDET